MGKKSKRDYSEEEVVEEVAEEVVEEVVEKKKKKVQEEPTIEKKKKIVDEDAGLSDIEEEFDDEDDEEVMAAMRKYLEIRKLRKQFGKSEYDRLVTSKCKAIRRLSKVHSELKKDYDMVHDLVSSGNIVIMNNETGEVRTLNKVMGYDKNKLVFIY